MAQCSGEHMAWDSSKDLHCPRGSSPLPYISCITQLVCISDFPFDFPDPLPPFKFVTPSFPTQMYEQTREDKTKEEDVRRWGGVDTEVSLSCRAEPIKHHAGKQGETLLCYLILLHLNPLVVGFLMLLVHYLLAEVISKSRSSSTSTSLCSTPSFME